MCAYKRVFSVSVSLVSSLVPLSLSLSLGLLPHSVPRFFLSQCRASARCLSDSVVTGSAAEISPLSQLNAIPYDRDKTSESHLKLVTAAPRDYRTPGSDRKHQQRCETPSRSFVRRKKKVQRERVRDRERRGKKFIVFCEQSSARCAVIHHGKKTESMVG